MVLMGVYIQAPRAEIGLITHRLEPYQQMIEYLYSQTVLL